MIAERQKNRIQKALTTFWNCCYATYDIGVYALNGRPILSSILFVPFGVIWGTFHSLFTFVSGYTFNYAPLDTKGHGPAYAYLLQRDLPTFRDQIAAIREINDVEHLYTNHGFSFSLFTLLEIKDLLSDDLSKPVLQAIGSHVAADGSTEIEDAHEFIYKFSNSSPRHKPRASPKRKKFKSILTRMDSEGSAGSSIQSEVDFKTAYESSVEDLFLLLSTDTSAFLDALELFVSTHQGRDAVNKEGFSILAMAVHSINIGALERLQELNQIQVAEGRLAVFKYKATELATLEHFSGLAKAGDVEALLNFLNLLRDDPNLQHFIIHGDPGPELLCHLIKLGLLGAEGDDSVLELLTASTKGEGLTLTPPQMIIVSRALKEMRLPISIISRLASIQSILGMLFSASPLPKEEDLKFYESELADSEDSDINEAEEWAELQRELIVPSMPKLSSSSALTLINATSWENQYKLISLLKLFVESSRALHIYPTLCKISLNLLKNWNKFVAEEDKSEFVPDIINIFLPIALAQLSKTPDSILPPQDEQALNLLRMIAAIVVHNGKLDAELISDMIARILAKGPVRDYTRSISLLFEHFKIQDHSYFARAIGKSYRVHLEDANSVLDEIEQSAAPIYLDINEFHRIIGQRELTPQEIRNFASLQAAATSLRSKQDTFLCFVSDATHLTNLLDAINDIAAKKGESLTLPDDLQKLLIARLGAEHAARTLQATEYDQLKRLMPETRFIAFIDMLYNRESPNIVLMGSTQTDLAVAQFFEIFTMSIDDMQEILSNLKIIDSEKTYTCTKLINPTCPASAAILYIIDYLEEVQRTRPADMDQEAARVKHMFRTVQMRLALNPESSAQLITYLSDKGHSRSEIDTIMTRLTNVISTPKSDPPPIIDAFRKLSSGSFFKLPISPALADTKPTKFFKRDSADT